MRSKRDNSPEYREKEIERTKSWQARNPLRYAFTNNRGSAQKRGLSWELTQERFNELVQSECFYCGAVPSPLNGIDRIDNDAGYVEHNVTTACTHCNYAKRRMTQADFIAWARRVVSNQER
jgi:hypothetical protein